jgi:hypothetical protein
MNIEDCIKIYTINNSEFVEAIVDDGLYLKCMCGFTNILYKNYTFENLILNVENIIRCHKCKVKMKVTGGILTIITDYGTLVNKNKFVKEKRKKKESPKSDKFITNKYGYKLRILQAGKK